MKLYIFGASGAGVTTLGKALSEKMHYSYLDSDDYLWEKTDPPYTTKRDKEERNIILKQDLLAHDNCILGGSIVSWGSDILPLFDLAVFLYLPKEVRLERLYRREIDRFGDIMLTDPFRNKQLTGLLEWAGGYDTDQECGRGLPIHENWISNAPCPILELRENITVQERIEAVLKKIKPLQPT